MNWILFVFSSSFIFSKFQKFDRISANIYKRCIAFRLLFILKKFKFILNNFKMIFNLKLNTRNAAIVHCKRKWLLKTDIKSFYESFSKEQLERAFHQLSIDLKPFCVIDEKALYEICTLSGKLPTGALTSAHIANYAFKLMKIDEVICEFCRQNEINYSRYMDDLTFFRRQKIKTQRGGRVCGQFACG